MKVSILFVYECCNLFKRTERSYSICTSCKKSIPKSLPSIPPFSYKRNTTLFPKESIFTQTTKDIFQELGKTNNYSNGLIVSFFAADGLSLSRSSLLSTVPLLFIIHIIMGSPNFIYETAIWIQIHKFALTEKSLRYINFVQNGTWCPSHHL